ncbi:MAG: exonuclease [Candidatus Paceibacterota bacterium]
MAKQKYFCVDIEADGPIPGDYSMIWFGAVAVEPGLTNTFEGKLKPISENFKPDALAVSGLTREDTLAFDHPAMVMTKFVNWVNFSVAKGQRPIFVSDNNGFDWMFMCWYMWHFAGVNPFGHSSASINWLYKGITKNFYKSFKFMRQTKHDHNPVNDAKGNAEAFMRIMAENGIR